MRSFAIFIASMKSLRCSAYSMVHLDFVRLLRRKAMTNHVIAESIEMIWRGQHSYREVFPTASHAVDHDDRFPIF